MRILFMGSPDFAVESLKALIAAKFEICAVVTQPDRPKGRGYTLYPTATGEFAEQQGFDVYKPEKLKNGELMPILEKYDPDVIVVAAYGKILPEYVLSYPKYGCVNVHASLLPAYRGASPINFAIINGEKETGITTMLMDKGLDTGDILMQQSTPIYNEDNAETLHDRLAVIGGELLCKTLYGLEDGTVTPVKQTGDFSYAPLITAETKKSIFF
jgi:methionyl-tRNA formyltransferase